MEASTGCNWDTKEEVETNLVDITIKGKVIIRIIVRLITSYLASKMEIVVLATSYLTFEREIITITWDLIIMDIPKIGEGNIASHHFIANFD